jgi:hypothetical protein
VSVQFGVFFGSYALVRFSRFLEPAMVLSFVFAIIVYKLYTPAVVGSACVVAGTLMNKFVIAQNGGKMPVFPSLSYLTGYTDPQALGSVDSLHVLGNASSKFKFLTDYIDVGYSVLSPGDVLIHLFAAIMLYQLIKAVNLGRPAVAEKLQVKEL